VTDLVSLLGPVAGAMIGGTFALARSMLARRSVRTESMEYRRTVREAVQRAADNGCLVVVVCGNCLGSSSTGTGTEPRP
jgi:hypothetical protein